LPGNDDRGSLVGVVHGGRRLGARLQDVFAEEVQQSRGPNAHRKDDDECHERRRDALMAAISTSGCRSTSGDAHLAAAAGATLALEAT